MPCSAWAATMSLSLSVPWCDGVGRAWMIDRWDPTSRCIKSVGTVVCLQISCPGAHDQHEDFRPIDHAVGGDGALGKENDEQGERWAEQTGSSGAEEKHCPSSRDGVGEGKKVTLSSVLGKRKQRRSPIDACVVGVGGRGI